MKNEEKKQFSCVRFLLELQNESNRVLSSNGLIIKKSKESKL
jgi:hypothetical protein